MATAFDSATGITTTYYYDLLGRALYYTKQGPNLSQTVYYTYDAENNLESLTETVGNSTQGYDYTYDDNNRITSVTVGDTTVTYSYDAFSRLTQKVTKQGETVVKTEDYTFVDWIEETDEGKKTYTSMQVASYAVTTGGTTTTWTYTYDANGNILTISDGTHTTSYVYDSANQLVEEYNEAEEYAHFWVYDNAGNIRSRTEYTYIGGALGEVTDTVEYAYKDGYTADPVTGEDMAPAAGAAWGDLLTAYDGNAITYDGIGNPLTWGNRTFTWERGRQLASLTENGTTWTYTYGADGLRIGRTNGTTTYSYVYNGSQLIQMTVGTNTLRFTYDAAGTPLTVNYNGTTYYYTTNLQGDVTGVVTANGTEFVRYAYSSWGVVLQAEGVAAEDNAALADTLAELNPLRYRGYVYDTETALYYLQSRYYDPVVGRFINADGYTSTGQSFVGNNSFSYCLNLPTLFADEVGERACVIRFSELSAQRDVTDEIFPVLVEEAEKAREHALDVKNRTLLDFTGYVMISFDFYNQVNHCAPWDIKRRQSWEETIGTPYPGGAIVQFGGLNMSVEDLGNLTYGYLGRAYGQPLEMLFAGSYYAAGFPTESLAVRHEIGHDWFFITLGFGLGCETYPEGVWFN